MRLVVPIVFVLSSSVSMTAGSQRSDDGSTRPVQISTRLVRVDAVVTNKKGQTVADLRPGELEVFEDGKRRPIVSLVYVDPTPAVRPPLANTAARTRAEQSQATSVAPEYCAIVIDDVSFSPEARTRAQHLVGSLVDRLVGEARLMLIWRRGGGAHSIQDFTSNKVALHGVSDRIPGYPALRGMEPQQRVGLSLSLLKGLGTLLREMMKLPGRKSLLILSQGFFMYDASDTEGVRVLDALRSVTDDANRAGVVLYSLDPGGLRSDLPEAADLLPANPALHEFNAVLEAERREVRRGLTQLADATGGIATFDSNDLGPAVERMMPLNGCYYLIGFEPDAESFFGPGHAAKWHKLVVRVGRKGLMIRHRRMYFARSEQ